MKFAPVLKRRSEAAFDFTAFGENSLDTIALGPTADQPAGKRRLTSLSEMPGGQASTAAVCAARLGWRVQYAGVVGDDEAGAIVSTELAAESVDVLTLTRFGARTRRAVVLVDEATSERVVLEYRDPALNAKPGEFSDSAFTDTRILLVDGTDVAQSLRAAQLARAAGVRTLVDVDRADPPVQELLRWIDVIALPEPVVTALAGVPDLGRALAQIGQMTGAAVVIATLGAGGALAWSGGREVRVDGLRIATVDTTGAGDAFRAGFAASWLGRSDRAPDLQDLLQDANLVASLSCRGLGAQTALPHAEEVPAHLRGGV